MRAMRLLLALMALSVVAAAPAQAGTVNVTVSGSGTVTDSQGQISCPPTCSATYPAGPVTFTANPASGASFTGWGGGCAQYGTQPDCTVNGDFDANIGAGFSDPSGGGEPPPPPPDPEPPPVDRRNAGTVAIGFRDGIVRHASSNDGVSEINCVYRDGRPQDARPRGTGGCESAPLLHGTVVTLTLVPIPGTQIANVNTDVQGDLPCRQSASSAVPGDLDCDVRVIGGTRTVVNTIIPRGFPGATAGRLAVDIRGTGIVHGPIDRPGAPSFDPFGAVCPVWCLFEARSQAGGDLRAEPVAGSRQVFDHWSGDCRPNGASCQMPGRTQAGHEATAHFRAAGTWSFEIQGGGQINVDPGMPGDQRDPDAPDVCRESCSHTMKQGRRYFFEADADPGWVFSHFTDLPHQGVISYCSNFWRPGPFIAGVRIRRCDIREEPGRHHSRAVFRPAVGEGRIRLAVQGPGTIAVGAGAGSRRSICNPGSCVDNLIDRRQNNRNAYYMAFPGRDARFVRWEGCDETYELRTGGEEIRACRAGDLFESTPSDRVIRAVFADDPRVRLRIVGRGRFLYGDNLRSRCEEDCTVRVRAGTGTLRLEAAAEEEDGYYFLEYRDWCGEWFRSRGPDCTLGRLWDDTTVTAVFRRRPIVFLTVQGGGVVRSVTGPFGEPAQRDLACRASSSPCRVRTIEPRKWRRLRAIPEPGWRFDRWEGECYRLPSAFNRNELCDVEGNDPQRTARAIFVRA